MNEKRINKKDTNLNSTNSEQINTKLISFIAGGMSFGYQYKLLEKNNFAITTKIGICSASFVICYGVTNYILNNINTVLK